MVALYYWEYLLTRFYKRKERVETGAGFPFSEQPTFGRSGQNRPKLLHKISE